MSEVSTEVTQECPVDLTPGAVSELSRLITEKSLSPDVGLRVGVEGGGCAGLSYIMGFDYKKDDDMEFQSGDLRVYVNKAQGMYLTGMQIDYHVGLENRGFVFTNPNASSTCGCGSSFSA